MPTITVDIRAVGAEGVSRSMEQAARSIGQNLPRAAATAERAVSGLTGRMEILANVTARVRSQAVGAFAGFIGAGALAGATKSIIDASNAMIGFRNSLAAATGGSEGASKSLAFVRFEAERLGLSLETASKQFASISNSARGTSLEGEGVQKVFTSIAQASRVMNLSNEATQGAFVAISQMMGKSQIMAEELRGQLAERVPGAVKIMADALGKTIPELNKMMENGELKGDAATDALMRFAEQLDKIYAIQAMNAANSPAAEFARLGNAIFDLQNAIGSSGLMDSLAGISRSFTEGIRGIIEGGWIDKITEGMKALATAIGLAFTGRAIASVADFRKGMLAAADETIKVAGASKLAAQASVEQARESVVATAARAKEALAQRDFYAGTNNAYAAQRRYSVALKASRDAVLQLAAAEEAFVVAANQATAATTRMQVALARMGAIAKTAFAAIGGWFTVAIAGIYGVYKAYEYLTTGTEESAKATEKATTLIDQNARANARLIVQLRGVSEENANTIVAFDELNASIAASTTRLGELQAKYEGISSLSIAGTIAKLANPSGLIADVATGALGGESVTRDAADYRKNTKAVEEATKARQEFANSIIHTARVQEAYAASEGKSSDALEKAMKLLELNGIAIDIRNKGLENSRALMTDAAQLALNLAVANDKEAIAQGTASAAVIRAIDTYAAAGVELGVLIDMLEKAGAAQAYFAALFDRGGQSDSGVTTVMGSKGLADIEAKIRAMEVQADKTGKLAAEEIRLDAAMAAALATRQEDKDAIIARGEVLAQMTIAARANAAAQKEATKAEKELQSILSKMPGMLDAARQKIEELEEADGRYSSALRELNKTKNQANQILENAARLLKARKIGAEEFANAEAVANRLVDEGVAKHARLTAAIEEEAAAINGLIPKLEAAQSTLGMDDRSRYIQEAVNDAAAAYASMTEEIAKTEGPLDAYIAKATAAAAATYDLERLNALMVEGAAKSPYARMAEDVDLLTAAIKRGADATGKAFTAKQIIDMQKQVEKLNKSMEERNRDLLGQGITSLQSMAKEGTAAYTALGIAQDILAYKSAMLAIANQGGGDVYTAFARMAAMAALLASIGLKVGGSFGGGGPAANSAEVRQANQGTGTVLGDATAKSESIARAVEITASATQQLVGINRSMLHAMQSLEAGLSGAGGLLARGAGGIDVGPLNSGGSFLGINLGNIFGGKESLRDQGIRIVGGTLNAMIDDIMVQSYATIHRSGGWFSSSRNFDRTQQLGDDVAVQFQLVLASMADAVRGAAEALGMDLDAINAAIAAYRIEEIRISTMDLSAEEAQAELAAVFSSIFDGLAGAVVPFIGQFQQVGEGLGETLIRVATGVQVTQEAIKQLGFALDETDPERFAQISEGLIGLVGGIDAFIEGMSTFVNAFATDEHKFKVAQEALTSAFDQFGLAIPSTRDAMWDLMQSLDATTDAGREQIAMLLRLAGTADSYYNLLEDREKERLRALASYNDFIDQFRPDDRLPTGADAGTIAEAQTQAEAWALAMIDQANALAVAAGLAAAAEGDLALIHQAAADAVAAATARIQAAQAALLARRADITSGLQTDIDRMGMTDYERQVADIHAQRQGYIDSLMETGLSLAAATNATRAWRDAMLGAAAATEAARVAEAKASYDEATQNIADQLAGLRGATTYMQEMVRIDRQYSDQVSTLNAHARAAGQAGAAERDLTRAMQVATLARAKALAALMAEAQALADELYGTPLSRLDGQIASLQEQENAAAAALSGFTDAISDAGRAAAEAMGLLLGSYSPLRASDKLPIALQALQRGETDANTVLQIARDVYSSGAAYNNVFAQVQSIVASLPSATGTTGGASNAYASGAQMSDEMRRLTEERDALMAQQAEAQRFMRASDLAGMLAQLAPRREESYEAVAAALGFTLDQLAADLRLGDLDALAEYLGVLTAEQASIAMLFDLPTAGDLAIIEAIEGIGGDNDLVGITPVTDPIPVITIPDTATSARDEQQAADTREVRDLLRVLISRGVTANEDSATTLERIAEGVEALAVGGDGGAAMAALSRRGA